MNEKQLLNELKTKYYKIGIPRNAEASETGRAIRKAEGVEWFIVGVYDRSGASLIRKNISYYVENKGKVNEKAFYAENKPQAAQPETKEQVWNPDTLLSAQGYAGYQVETVNTAQKWAIADVYIADKASVTKSRVFVTESGIKAFGV